MKFGNLFTRSIYRRVFFSFTIIIALILIVSIVSYYQLTRFRVTLDQAISSSSQMAPLQTYALSLSSLETDLDRFFVIGGVDIQESIFQDVVNMKDALKSMTAPELQAKVTELGNTTSSLETEIQRLVEMKSASTDSRAMNEQILTTFAQIDQAKQLQRELSTETLDHLQDTIRNQESFLTNTITQLVILAIMAIVVAVVASLRISRSIAAPLSAMAETATQIAAGDLEARVVVKSQDETGRLASAFNTMAEATKLRTEQLVLAHREAREANRLKDEFLAIMSHELRTPLNAIIGYQGIMEMMGDLPEKHLQRVKRTRANSERLLHLIDDILDISRIESGRLEIVPSRVHIRELTDSLRRQMNVLADEKGLGFDILIDSDVPPTIWADEDSVAKIMTNLLANAFKFTSEGEVGLHIGCDNRTWHIQVKDTGIGIPAHMHEIIFERFRQVDGSSKREYGGTGLGLAIVRQLSEAMGGNIRVDSAPGQGSMFTVTLPLELAPEPASQPVPAI